MLRECLALTRFLLGAFRPWSSIVYSILLGLLGPLASVIFGLLVDEVAGSNRQSDDERVRMTWIYTAALVLLFLVHGRVYYEFETDVPEGGARYRVRHMVMHKLWRLPTGSAVLQGASPAVMNDCSHAAVNNLFSNFFGLITQTTLVLDHATVVLVVCLNHVARGDRVPISSLVAIGLVLCGLFVVVPGVIRFYRGRNEALSRLECHWQLRYSALASLQLGQLQAADAPPADSAAQVQAFGDAAFIYHKRSFQNYFTGLVTTDVVSTIMYTFYAGMCIGCGIDVINGYTTIGEYFMITTAVSTAGSACQAPACMLKNYSAGHASLVPIADVLNADERHDHPLQLGAGGREPPDPMYPTGPQSAPKKIRFDDSKIMPGRGAEAGEDEGVHPDCSWPGVLAALPAALEQERRFHANWWRLTLRQTWLRSLAAAPVAAPAIPPDDAWAGTPAQLWPGNVPTTGRPDRMLTECRAFLGFLWGRTRPWASVLLSAALGLLPGPATSVLFGLLVDEVAGSHQSHSREQRIVMTVVYTAALVLVCFLNQRGRYYFQVTVLEVIVRFQLRHRIMRKLHRLPPGSAVLQRASPDLVNVAVNNLVADLWSAVFKTVTLSPPRSPSAWWRPASSSWFPWCTCSTRGGTRPSAASSSTGSCASRPWRRGSYSGCKPTRGTRPSRPPPPRRG